MTIETDFPHIDEHGKRYREFGHGCREYAPELVTAYPTGVRPKPPEPPIHRRDCPFSTALDKACSGHACALFDGDGCRLSAAHPGKRCPLPAHLTCGERCAMFESGRCTLFCGRKDE